MKFCPSRTGYKGLFLLDFSCLQLSEPKDKKAFWKTVKKTPKTIPEEKKLIFFNTTEVFHKSRVLCQQRCKVITLNAEMSLLKGFVKKLFCKIYQYLHKDPCNRFIFNFLCQFFRRTYVDGCFGK